MSFAVTVIFGDGAPEVITAGVVPAGQFTITGHDNATEASLSVTQRAPDGRYVQIAASTHHKES